MFKKERSKVYAEKKNLYCLFDKVTNCYRFDFACYCHTDGEYVRNVLPIVAKQFSIPDVEYRHLLSVDGSQYRTCEWTAYKFIEKVADNLAPLGVTEKEAMEMLKKEGEKKIVEDSTTTDSAPSGNKEE